jgi:hypothetical protein
MSEEQFLRECGKSYPEAMAALAHFRQVVLKQCEPVVRDGIRELGKVLGVPADSLKLTKYADPEKLVPNNETQYELGWIAKRSENLEICFYVYWYSEQLGVAIHFWIKDSGKQEGLKAKLSQHIDDPKVQNEPWNIDDTEFYLEMKEGDLPRVADKLRILLDYTIKYLRSLGPIKPDFRP